MSHKRPSCWWRGHVWREGGLIGPLTMRDVCTRCGLIRVFNGALDETEYFLPTRGDQA